MKDRTQLPMSVHSSAAFLSDDPKKKPAIETAGLLEYKIILKFTDYLVNGFNTKPGLL
jgi:hypothetical protein